MAGEGPIEERLSSFFNQEKYREMISRAVLAGKRSVPVDFNDLLVFDSEFASALVEDPMSNLKILDAAAFTQAQIEHPAQAGKLKRFHARVRGLPEKISIRQIRSEHLGKLIQLDGIVVRASTVRPMLMVARYRCRYCGREKLVKSDDVIQPPGRCESPRCIGRRPSFELIQESSEYIDYQLIGIQEKPEDLPPGQIPRLIEVRLVDDIVDVASPGDRVAMVGVLKSTLEVRRGVAPNSLKLHLEGISVETVGKEADALLISPEEEEAFRRMAQDKDLYSKLIASVAPSIKGHEYVKEAILLALFGGRQKVFSDGVKVRGDVHLLLVGDPGTAKSTLLQFASQIAPRGVYTSGRGSTAAGLTAAVVRDAGGLLVLEAGACVLADMGVCVVDEIDKMRPEDRVAMHEVMAQQTVSIAKGGIVATLNARCSILAAANPELGRYDIYRSFNENVNLPITLLSRFDIIFVLRDEPIKEVDRSIASHIVGLHGGSEQAIQPPIPPNVLKKYISYSKRVEPVLSKDAMDVLQEFYLQMRSVYERTSTISITARQLESLIRLAEARARVELRKVVTKEDAEAAIALMKKSLSEVGIDVETGRPDIDVIMTGKPKSVREKLTLVLDIIKRLQEQHGYADDTAVRHELEEQGLTRGEIDRIINRMLSEGKIYSPKPGAYRLT
ncbi:MAG: minichromosome maintenance protein MCM [Aigarchaeota archaeon]|nr:minichromosome maintenance protein MCM [Aigarchaeota archaeon]MDW8092917.1 minichromosome maintenance protein MCM [Nitrososphaerota archaeon]